MPSLRALRGLRMGIAAAFSLTAFLIPAPESAETPAGAALGIPVDRSTIPAGTEYLVSAPGNEGDGSFGAAVDAINAGGVPATIRFAPDLDAELSGTWQLNESVTIRGDGATVTWTQPDSEELWSSPWLSVQDANLQMFDLTVVGTRDNWEPMISLDASPDTYTNVFDGVSLQNVNGGGINVNSAGADLDVTGLHVSRSFVQVDPDEEPVLQIEGGSGSVSIAESTFVGVDSTAIAIAEIDVNAEQQVRLVNNSFLEFTAEEAEYEGLAVSIEEVSSIPAVRAEEPAVLLAGNTFSQLGGVGVSGIVAVDGVVGGIALRENSFTEVTSGSETLTVSWVEGSFGAGETMVMEDLNFSGVSAGSSVIRIDDIAGFARVDQLVIERATSKWSMFEIADVLPVTSSERAAVVLRDLSIRGGGDPDMQLDAGLLLEGIDGDVVFDRLAVEHVSADRGAVVLAEITGGLLVDDTVIADNTSAGLVVEELELETADQRVEIRDSRFVGNVAQHGDVGAGITVIAEVNVARTSPAIVLRDTTVQGNSDGEVAGALLSVDTAVDRAGADIWVENSTFENPDAAAHPSRNLASDLVMKHEGASQNGVPVNTVRNTTVERRNAAGTGSHAAIPAIRSTGADAQTRLEHVSVPGGAIAQECGTGGEGLLSVHNSVLGPEDAPAVILVGDQCEIEGAANTVPYRGTLPVQFADELPIADWQLGDLADNGGATQTLLPGVDSPLANAAMASDVLTDQRGVARPQGGAPDRGAVERELSVVEIGADASVRAGDPATLVATRGGEVSEAARVSVTLHDGTAIAGTDYTAKTIELTWAAGDAAAKEFSVDTLQSVPGVREFTAALDAVAGTALGDRTVARVTITQDEATTDPVTDPGTDPVTDPGTDPVTDPGTDPVTDPGTDPVTEPVTDPGTDPATEPGLTPGPGEPKSPLASTGADSPGFIAWAVLLFTAGGLLLAAGKLSRGILRSQRFHGNAG